MAQECMRMVMRCVMQCPRVCQTKQCRCSKKSKWCANVVFEHMHGSGSAETQTNFCLINIFYLILLHVSPFCSDSGWMVKLHPQEVGMLKSSNLQTHLPPKQWKPLLLPHIAAVRRLINPSEWTFKHARQTPHFHHRTFHKQIGSNRWKANKISHECGELLCTWKTLWKHSWKCCEKNIIASSHSGLRTVGQHCCDAVLRSFGRSFGWNARTKMMNIRFSFSAKLQASRCSWTPGLHHCINSKWRVWKPANLI